MPGTKYKYPVYTAEEVSALRQEVVDSVSCPRCGAPKGEPCWSAHGKPRKTLHTERRALFKGRTPRPRAPDKIPRHPLAEKPLG